MVRSTSIVREEEKNRYSCFMIFAPLLLIHWLKPAHHSLSVLAFIQVQLYSRIEQTETRIQTSSSVLGDLSLDIVQLSILLYLNPI